MVGPAAPWFVARVAEADDVGPCDDFGEYRGRSSRLASPEDGLSIGLAGAAAAFTGGRGNCSEFDPASKLSLPRLRELRPNSISPLPSPLCCPSVGSSGPSGT